MNVAVEQVQNSCGKSDAFFRSIGSDSFQREAYHTVGFCILDVGCSPIREKERTNIQHPIVRMETSMQFQEVVEAQGHLIDSHVMEQIFDKVVEYNSRFEVEQFRIGRTNSDASYLRLKVEAPEPGSDGSRAAATAGSRLLAGRYRRTRSLRSVERDRCAPEDFYSTTNHRTLIRARTAVARREEPAHGRAEQYAERSKT